MALNTCVTFADSMGYKTRVKTGVKTRVKTGVITRVKTRATKKRAVLYSICHKKLSVNLPYKSDIFTTKFIEAYQK